MSLLNPVERETYALGSVVTKLAKPLFNLFEDSSAKAIKSKMNSVHNAVEKAEADNTKYNFLMNKSDIFRMVAKDQDVTPKQVKDIEKVFAYRSGGGGGNESILGETVQTLRAMTTKPTSGQKISEELGGTVTTRAARKAKGEAVVKTGLAGLGLTAAGTTGGYFAGLSAPQKEKVKENKSSSVTNITSGTMDDAFSKASKNPTKYVFIKQGQPHFMYKGKAVPFALATEESDVVLDMVPREKNTKGSLMRRNEERPVPGFAPISNTDRKEYFQLQDALQDGSKTPEELTQADRDLIKMVEAVLEAERQERERKVNGGITVEDRINNAAMLLEEGKINNREAVTMASKTLSLATSQKELDRLKFQIKYKFATGGEDSSELGFIPQDIKNKIDNFKLGDSSYKTFEENRNSKAKGGKFPDLTGDGEVTQADVLKGRGVFNEGGSMLLPPELQETPVDTYTPEDQANAEATQVSDDMMEKEYVDYIINESLDDDEQNYLAEALTNDPRLSDIMDKVFVTASEFTGSGEVEGPGTGVSDSIPARLSDGEFVMTRKATDQIGADNLQRMMDDAERAYDGGLQSMAVGGMVEDEDPENMSQTDEEIKKLMMGANQMPSLR